VFISKKKSYAKRSILKYPFWSDGNHKITVYRYDKIERKFIHKLLLCGLLGVHERRHGPNLRNLNLAAEYDSPETSRGLSLYRQLPLPLEARLIPGRFLYLPASSPVNAKRMNSLSPIHSLNFSRDRTHLRIPEAAFANSGTQRYRGCCSVPFYPSGLPVSLVS
jgi:hypothetical protein